MDSNKKTILDFISQSLKGKVSDFYIIGSFFEDHWAPNRSDIDIICVDASFEEYRYPENKKYVKNILSDLPYNFDITIYTFKQF